jgi:hypothetical protein
LCIHLHTFYAILWWFLSVLILTSLYIVFPLWCLFNMLAYNPLIVDSPKKGFVKWVHCLRFFSSQYSLSENRTLDPGPRLLRVHILGSANYPSVSNKGAWWRHGKENYYTARRCAVGWVSISTELMFTICRVQTWDIDLNRQRIGSRDQTSA